MLQGIGTLTAVRMLTILNDDMGAVRWVAHDWQSSASDTENIEVRRVAAEALALVMGTITRDGVPWELRAPKQVHYSARWDDGHLLLHANPECSRVKVDAVVVSPKIVATLWDKDVQDSTTMNENDVMWCENCAARRVD